MHILKNLRSDNGMQIGLHEIEHQIDILIVLSLDQMLKADNIRMAV